MSILQRYVLRELAGPVFISVLFFSFLMMLRQLFRFAELLLEARVGFDVFMEFILIIVATLIIVTVPMAGLLGCLVGVGRLTAENEILAMRVAGLSLPKIFAPVFGVAAIGSVILMVLGFNFLPGLFNRLVERQNEILFDTIVSLEPGRLYDELETKNTDISLFYEKRGANAASTPHTLSMEQVAIRIVGSAADLTGADLPDEEKKVVELENDMVREERRETLIFAERGQIRGNLEERSVTFLLEEGTIMPLNFVEIFDAEGKIIDQFRANREQEVQVRFATLEETFIPGIATPGEGRVDPTRMTFRELREFQEYVPWMEMYLPGPRQKLHPHWQAYLSVRNEMYQRIALPWSLLSFVLIAIPLAVELRPRAKTFSFLVAIGLLTLYYAMLTVAGALGMVNSPLTGAAYFAPNAVIGGIGLFLFWRVQR